MKLNELWDAKADEWKTVYVDSWRRMRKQASMGGERTETKAECLNPNVLQAINKYSTAQEHRRNLIISSTLRHSMKIPWSH